MTVLTSRNAIERAIISLKGRPYSIIVQCTAEEAPVLREIVLGVENVELHPFDIGTMRSHERDEVARDIYERSYRSHATPTVYVCTGDLRVFGEAVLRRVELLKVSIEAEPA